MIRLRDYQNRHPNPHDQNWHSSGNFGSFEKPLHRRYEPRFSREFRQNAIAVGVAAAILVLTYLGIEYRDRHYAYNTTQNDIVYSIPKSDK